MKTDKTFCGTHLKGRIKTVAFLYHENSNTRKIVEKVCFTKQYSKITRTLLQGCS